MRKDTDWRGHCRLGRGLSQKLRDGLPGEVEDVGGDGAELGGFEDQVPSGHAGALDALGDDPKHLLGLAAVLPLTVADVADGRTQQAARDRTVAASFQAVAGRTAGEVDRPAFEQQGIARDFRRRGRGRRPEHEVRESPGDDQAQHSQEDPARRRGINCAVAVVIRGRICGGQGGGIPLDFGALRTHDEVNLTVRSFRLASPGCGQMTRESTSLTRSGAPIKVKDVTVESSHEYAAVRADTQITRTVGGKELDRSGSRRPGDPGLGDLLEIGLGVIGSWRSSDAQSPGSRCEVLVSEAG